MLHQFRHEPHRIGWLMGKTLLTPLHSKWIKELWDLEKHTGLQGHRGSYKTTGPVIVGSVYWLLFHPNARIAICRKTKTDANKTLRAIKEGMKVPAIRELFKIAHGSYPEFVTEKEDELTFTFKTEATVEGNVSGYGVESAMTGLHFDKVLCDDIVGKDDRYSEATRKKARMFYEELVTNIIDPGKQVMHNGTPWHKKDAWELYEDLVKKGIAEPLKKYDCFSTGILSEKALEDKRSTTSPSLFAANYLLKHQASDDALYASPSYSPLWYYGQRAQVYAHLDAAFGGDCFNGFTIGQKLDIGEIQVIGAAWEGHVSKHYATILEWFKTYKVTDFLMEENADKGFTGREIMQKAREAGLNIKFHPYHEWQNKTHKMSTLPKYHWNNLRFVNKPSDLYIGHICDWQEGAIPDDALDSLASLLRFGYGQLNDNSELMDLYKAAYG